MARIERRKVKVWQRKKRQQVKVWQRKRDGSLRFGKDRETVG